MKSNILIAAIVLSSTMLIACEKNAPVESNATETKSSPQVQEIENFLAEAETNVESKVETAHPTDQNPFSNTLSGELLETFDASSFTYVKIKTAGGFAWAAGPTTTAKKGDVISFDGKTPMANFHSKSLNKTFEMIYFVNSFSVNGIVANSGIKDPAM